MPIKRCQIDGHAGYKWGDSGKCYTGANARQKAVRQGLAAHANGYKEKNEVDGSGFDFVDISRKSV